MSAGNVKKNRVTTLSPNDHISTLSDELISNILSRLPTEAAMKTSVLSRSWEHKWTSVYDINVDDNVNSKSDKVGFINYVTMVLLRTCNSRIRSFCIKCGERYDRRYIETWISYVLMRNVENIAVHAAKLIRIHSSEWYFRNWTSLIELELHTDCTLVLPIDSLLPNLKSLILVERFIKIKQEQVSSEGRVILTFPVLERLVLQCEWLDVNFVEIHAPKLITYLNVCLFECKNYEIKIFGAKLATFNSKDGTINNFDLHGCPAVSCAKLEHSNNNLETCARVYKILKQLPVLECLTLPGELAEILVPSNSGLVFPTFDRLRELNLFGSNNKDLVELLQLLPQVERLYIDVGGWDDYHPPWPPLIVSNLMEVELRSFNGHTVQLEFLIFVLENAKKLKKMSVVVGSEARGIVKATMNLISTLLRTISNCVVEVI